MIIPCTNTHFYLANVFVLAYFHSTAMRSKLEIFGSISLIQEQLLVNGTTYTHFQYSLYVLKLQ